MSKIISMTLGLMTGISASAFAEEDPYIWLEEVGGEKPLYYYENTEGGHAGAANLKQSAYVNALIYSYLLDQLK